jgi:hypothetical protein
VINQARIEILKSLNLPSALPDDDHRVREVSEPSFKVRVRAKSKDMFIDEEVRRRKYVLRDSPKLHGLTLCTLTKSHQDEFGQ